MAGSETPTLLTADGQPAVNRTLQVPVGGLRLVLRVPAVAPGHLELAEADLALAGPAGMAELVGGTTAGLAVTTNLGPLSANWAQERAGKVGWLTADWGERRALVGLTLSAVLPPPPPQEQRAPAFLARLKVSDGGGAWYPPLPVDTVKPGEAQATPDVVCSRLMLEVMSSETEQPPQPSTLPLTGLRVRLAEQAADVRVRVGSQPPFWEQEGRLVPGRTVGVSGLLEALGRELPREGKALDIPLLLEAEVQGKVVVSRASFTARVVYTQPEGGVARPLDWGGEAVGRVGVGEGARLDEVRLTVVPELAAERFLVHGVPSQASAYAQLCAVGHQAAQQYAAPGERPLAGVDVLLRPTAARVRGTLALHPDAQGRPAEAPFQGTAVDFLVEETGSGPWPARWVPLALARPLKVEGPWWLVLSVSEGEALWPLAVRPTQAGPAAHRLRVGTWFEWQPPPESAWGLSRLRVAAGAAPPPEWRVVLRRGTARRELVPDGVGRVVASAGDLAALNAQGAAVLEVAVRSAGEPVRGVVRLEGLRVAVRRG